MSGGRCSAVLAAGGIGSRFGDSSSAPKQTRTLAGLPVYMWSLIQLLRHDQIDSVVLVSHASILDELKDEIWRCLAPGFALEERLVLVEGGLSRQESVYRGLQHLDTDSTDFVLIHDAARPFPTLELIDRIIESVRSHNACTAALALSETVKSVENGLIKNTIDRNNLYAAHTPQAGRLDWLLAGHAKARQSGADVTDDAAIIEMLQHEVAIVPSHRLNIKITVAEDLSICEALSHMFVGQINGYLR